MKVFLLFLGLLSTINVYAAPQENAVQRRDWGWPRCPPVTATAVKVIYVTKTLTSTKTSTSISTSVSTSISTTTATSISTTTSVSISTSVSTSISTTTDTSISTTTATSVSTTTDTTTSTTTTTTTSTAAPTKFPTPVAYGTGCFYLNGQPTYISVTNFPADWATALNQCIGICNALSGCQYLFLSAYTTGGDYTCWTGTTSYDPTQVDCNIPGTFGQYIAFAAPF